MQVDSAGIDLGRRNSSSRSTRHCRQISPAEEVQPEATSLNRKRFDSPIALAALRFVSTVGSRFIHPLSPIRYPLSLRWQNLRPFAALPEWTVHSGE